MDDLEKLQQLKRIAVELCEANRLKRIELHLVLSGGVDGISGAERVRLLSELTL